MSLKLQSRMEVTGSLRCESALHIGAGEEGRAAADSGVVKTVDGRPLVPGSSLKGVFRTAAERISHIFGLTACFLEAGAGCVSGDHDEERKARERLRDLRAEKVDGFLEENVCGVCRVFGSPLAAGKVKFADAALIGGDSVVDVRDGVGLDRESRTAVPKIKFNFEAVPAGSEFAFRMRGEDLSETEKALTWAVLLEWCRGFHLGGLTSRGLGLTTLQDARIGWVDASDREGFKEYLLRGTFRSVSLDEASAAVEHALNAAGSQT